MTLAMLLQRYDLQGAPGYELAVAEPGFFMPAGFTLTVAPRDPATTTALAGEELAEAARAAGCPHHTAQG